MCAAIKHNNKTRMGFSRAYTSDMAQQSPLIQHNPIKKKTFNPLNLDFYLDS